MCSTVSAVQPSRQIVASPRSRQSISVVSASSGVAGRATANATSNSPSRIGPFVALNTVRRNGRRPPSARRTSARTAAYSSSAAIAAPTRRPADSAQPARGDSFPLKPFRSCSTAACHMRKDNMKVKPAADKNEVWSCLVRPPPFPGQKGREMASTPFVAAAQRDRRSRR